MAESKELIFGTKNQGKIDQLKDALDGMGVIVIGMDELDMKPPEVVEDGATVVENARKKSLAYAAAFGRTVFSMDNALYFNGIPDEEQPGLYVRRIGGLEASTDEEMLQFYSAFLRDHGGNLEGWWEYGISLAQPDGTSNEDVIKTPRQFVAEPNGPIMTGYPLESLQVDPKTGKYIAEMSQEEKAKFWRDSVGPSLRAFITENL